MASSLAGLSFALLSDWATTFTLIFGGCCSNALTLEELTSQHPRSGSLITFAQFVLISLFGLRKHLVLVRPSRTVRFPRNVPYLRLKNSAIPLSAYLVQVVLFYVVSVLNNRAFAYKVPMMVHIIFRSGGLVVNMVLGRLLMGRRYTLLQTLSVLLVTSGVILTTLFASQLNAVPGPIPQTNTDDADRRDATIRYATGIAILALALVLSGLLGLVQDRTFMKYGRAQPSYASPTNGHAEPVHPKKSKSHKSKHKSASKYQSITDPAPQWQESMFYLHVLALPLFYFLRTDIQAQYESLTALDVPKYTFDLPLSFSTPFLSPSPPTSPLSPIPESPTLPSLTLSLPKSTIPLILTTLTSLLCVSGVHRLTARLSSLGVTLVLTVRKAASVVLSVLLFGVKGGSTGMWVGAAMVGVGTVGYAIGSGSSGGGTKREVGQEEKKHR